MNTDEFFARLAEEDLPLLFTIEGEDVPSNYHVSELKAASYASLDCGARAHRWQENTLHIFIPQRDGDDDRQMTTHKLTEIFTRTKAQIEMNDSAKLTVEYAENKNRGLAVYNIAEVSNSAESMRVHLEPMIAECKPLNDPSAHANVLNKTCCVKSSACCS